ncbi:MAG: hypothetical protein ACKOAC_06295, partial [Fluviibacter sp.]
MSADRAAESAQLMAGAAQMGVPMTEAQADKLLDYLGRRSPDGVASDLDGVLYARSTAWPIPLMWPAQSLGQDHLM